MLVLLKHIFPDNITLNNGYLKNKANSHPVPHQSLTLERQNCHSMDIGISGASEALVITRNAFPPPSTLIFFLLQFLEQ